MKNSKTTLKFAPGARLFLSLALASSLGGVSLGGPVKIELPPEKGSFKPGPGSEIANGQCLVCHSVEYVVTQPPMPLKFWAGSVKKMQDKFGAEIPADLVAPLADYLARTYGTGTNAAPAVQNAISPGATVGAGGGEAIAQRYGCLGCHNPNTKIVGPPYREIAAKYQNDPAAEAKISEQIHKGGSGKWGPIIMPPFPGVTEAETKALCAWILSLK